MLRKEFTGNIIEILRREKTFFNLIGKEGTGKTRLLYDIYNNVKNVKCVIFDMAGWYELDYRGFIIDLWKGIKKDGNQLNSIYDVLDYLEKSKEKVFLLLDNYDARLIKNNLRFNNNLYGLIMRIGNEKLPISILCTTKKSIKNLYPNPHPGWSNFLEGEIPKLTSKQIMGEINRRSMILTD